VVQPAAAALVAQHAGRWWPEIELQVGFRTPARRPDPLERQQLEVDQRRRAIGRHAAGDAALTVEGFA